MRVPVAVLPLVRRARWTALGSLISLMSAAVLAVPQTYDRLAKLPGHDRYAAMQKALASGPAFESGAITPSWADDSLSFTYASRGRTHRFDVQARTTSEVGPAAGRSGSPPASPAGAGGPCPRVPIERGRQHACAASPDGSMLAIHRDRNLYISRPDGSGEIAVTTDGDSATRIKYGTASWVYGEELDQITAMWWAPDGRRLAFYRFDESRVADYYTVLDQLSLQNALEIEAYPKTGTDNPIADVLVYDLATRRTVRLDVRDGQPFRDAVVGYYVYDLRWAPDGSEIWMHRVDRRQQILELAGCSPVTGACRRIVREEWPTGWVETHPTFRLLSDGTRFIWGSDRNGWRNYYLYELSGRLLNPITAHTAFEAGPIVRVDESAGAMWYMARSGDTFLKSQLHRVQLDGTNDRRLTDPRFTHTVTLSPDARYFVDVSQSRQAPPASQVMTTSGEVLATVATSSLARFEQLGLRTLETFTYMSADGTTPLVGTIAFPSSFDPTRRYPVLVPVYGGPQSSSSSPSETFGVPSSLTEFGFLVVNVSSRAVPGLGRRTLDAVYRRLGQTELEDVVAGVRAAASRPYVDASRIGIYGTSYGGYLAALGLARFPDVFAAASASSPVTDWRLYDTIYTERYMGLPSDNPDGYDRGSVMRYAGTLSGRLLLYYGTADNNVHPANSLQLIEALGRAGRSLEVQVGPDDGHSGVPLPRMLEFFVENLIARPERLR